MKHQDSRLAAAVIFVAVFCAFTKGEAVAQEWALVDSTSFQVLVPAGETCTIEARSQQSCLVVVAPTENITPSAEAALAVAPAWLERDLRDVFRRLNEADQNLYASLINRASHPYIDEVCFSVAHTAPQTLGAITHPAVLVENAESLYATDAYLAYADIVDYDNGGDYYSTIEYRVQEGEDILTFELPREQYYWYVVHPKLHKEVPHYILPGSGDPADPPSGVFWRDYLMNHNDDGYPLLRDALAGCDVLWKSRQNDLDNGAVGAVTQWIQDVMTFSSYPHHDQPVRIYNRHIGTCSVHSYLTSAAARAALIPTAVNVMYSDNHKINEFWDRRWIAWEPVNTYIDNPGGYENWGWDVAAAFNWRGDSFIWDETFHYTAVCTLDVNVVDAAGRPVDGARVKIYSSPCVAWGATAGWTGFDGNKRFLLGDERSYMAAVNSSLGTYPPSGMTTIITASEPGTNYSWDVTLPDAAPELPVSEDELPGNPTNLHRLVVEYSLPEEILYGCNFDDGGDFSEPASPGHMDFFICDQEEFDKYVAGEDFLAFEIAPDSPSGSVDFLLPSSASWYVVLSNESDVVLTQDLHVTAKFYAQHPTGAPEGEDAGANPMLARLHANYPNPFNPMTTIAFDIPQEGDVEMVVYDVAGRRIRTLVDDDLEAGRHTAIWDGRNERGREMSSGVFLVRLTTGDYCETRRMVLVR